MKQQNTFNNRGKFMYRFHLLRPLLRAGFNQSLAITLLLVLAFVQSAMAQESAALELKKPVERELKTAEAHAHKITLVADEFLHVLISVRGINLTARLLSPDGANVGEIEFLGDDGPYKIVTVAEKAGDYRLELEASKIGAAVGRYTATIEERRKATDEDKNLAAARRLFNEGVLLSDQRTRQSLRDAIAKFKEALPLARASADREIQIELLAALGFAHSSLTENQQALPFFEEALQNLRKLESKYGEATMLNNIGMVYVELGERRKSLDYFNQALPLRRAAEDRLGETNTLGNIGGAHLFFGEYQKALDNFNQALPQARAIRDRSLESYTLNGIGRTYAFLNEKQLALEFFNQALALRRALGQPGLEGAILSNIATVYKDNGEWQRAKEFYEQSLPLIKTGGDRLSEARALTNLGIVYASLDDEQKALDFYNQSLTLARAGGNRDVEAGTLTNIGTLYNDDGEWQKAIDFYNSALTIHRAAGNRSGEAATVYGIARANRGLGNLDEALTLIEKALAIVEALRTNISNPALRASYFVTVQKYYQLHTDLLMQLHGRNPSGDFEARALQSVERARARSLLELLIESRADIRQGVAPALLERERDVRQLIAGKAERQTRLLNNKNTADKASEVAKEIDILTAEYEQVQNEIRRASPRYAALTQPLTVSVKTIQTELLDRDTLLLEYSLGEKKSYLWAITSDKLESFELPKREIIETQAREVYRLLTSRNEQKKDETAVRRRERITRAEAELTRATADLSRLILAPVAGKLSNKRLLIVADGALQYIPFAALKLNRAKNKDAAQKFEDLFLVETNEIINLPSASVLAQLRRDTAERKPAPKMLAIFADPVFNQTDSRLNATALKKNNRHTIDPQKTAAGSVKNSKTSRGESESPEIVSKDLIRAFGDASVGETVSQISRLPFSRREAQNILALAGTNQTLSAFDFKANLETVKSPQLANYRIIHFATHGLLDNARPGLSGIVLSLVDEDGKPRDGFLRLNEIYNLKLPADLIVLSACQTALGRDVRGEGLVGLTRGFMYAGASRVAASLWQVDDAATAELIRLFYQKMLKENLRPAAALRAAQLELLAQKRFSSPYYWAAFTLQGDWK